MGISFGQGDLAPPFLIPVLDTSAMIVIPQLQIISSHHHYKADHVHPSRLQK